jgi:hypothetical protein
MTLGVFLLLFMDDMHQGGTIMQIILNVGNKHNEETKEKALYFEQLMTRLEKDDFNIFWSREKFEEGSAILAVIDIEEEYDQVTKSYKIKKNLYTMQNSLVGYMFCSYAKNKYPLSAKRLLENYEEIIVKCNARLLSKLYELEFQE